MKTTTMLCTGVLAAAVLALAAGPLQDGMGGHGEQPAGGDPMMEAMIKAGMPGPQHAEFAKLVGTWKAVVKSWHDPTQPALETVGSSRYEMVLDGRYLVEHHSGEMPGMGPFTGMGITAYNNATGEYQHVWMDSMSTGMFVSTGTEAEDGTCHFTGEMDNPMGGEKIPCRMVLTQKGPDERHFEMHGAMGGPEMKMMEITYTRGTGTR